MVLPTAQVQTYLREDMRESVNPLDEVIVALASSHEQLRAILAEVVSTSRPAFPKTSYRKALDKAREVLK